MIYANVTIQHKRVLNESQVYLQWYYICSSEDTYQNSMVFSMPKAISAHQYSPRVIPTYDLSHWISDKTTDQTVE